MPPRLSKKSEARLLCTQQARDSDISIKKKKHTGLPSTTANGMRDASFTAASISHRADDDSHDAAAPAGATARHFDAASRFQHFALRRFLRPQTGTRSAHRHAKHGRARHDCQAAAAEGLFTAHFRACRLHYAGISRPRHRRSLLLPLPR